MLITLKQREIEAALRLYVSQNGINLTDKTIDIAFTAGRKESGLSAEVNISDDGSKALEDAGGAATAVAAVTAPVTAALPVAPVQADPAPVAAGEAPADPAPVVSSATGTSLFG